MVCSNVPIARISDCYITKLSPFSSDGDGSCVTCARCPVHPPTRLSDTLCLLSLLSLLSVPSVLSLFVALRHRRQPLLEQTSFRLRRRQRQRAREGVARLGEAPGTAAEFGARGMREALVNEFAARQQLVNENDTRCDAITHGDGHGAIQVDHG